jgi:malate/lactate dehydrogenase
MLLARTTLRPRSSFALARALATKAETVKAFEADQKALAAAYDECSSNDEFLKLKETKLAPLYEKLKKLDTSKMGWTYSRVLCNPLGPPKVVAVTGAGTATGAEALYRIAAGEMLGGSQPVTLQVSGADPAVLKDLHDCAFSCLAGVTAASSAAAAVKGADIAIILEGGDAALGGSLAEGALVAVKGMANAAAVASKSPQKVVVTGITRTLQASAEAQIADKVGCSAHKVSKVVVWGNDAIDVSSAMIDGKWAVDVLGDWTPEATEPIPEVGADAVVAHMKDLALGSDPDEEWSSMGVEAQGAYGLGKGFFYSVPVTCKGKGLLKRVGGIPITPALAQAMEAQRVALSK